MFTNDKIDPNSVTVVYATDDPATVAAYRAVLADMRAFDERQREDLDRLGATQIAHVPGPNGEYGENIGLFWPDEGAMIPTGWDIGQLPRLNETMLFPADGDEGAEARRWLDAQVRPDRHAVMAEHGLPRHPRSSAGAPQRALIMEWEGTVWAAYRDAPETAPADHWTLRTFQEWKTASTADGSPWPEPKAAGR